MRFIGQLVAVLAGWGANQSLAQGDLETVWMTNAHSKHYNIHDVAFSGDSRLLVSGAQDRTVKVWTTTNAVLVRTFGISDGAVYSVAISVDGGHVAAGNDDGKTGVWRVTDGSRLWIGGPNNFVVYSLCFSPVDSWVGIGRGDGINVRESLSGAGIPFSEPPGEVFGVAFSPDGRFLASANANYCASLWRVPEGSLVLDFIGHSNAVYSVDFSPDGTLLATASGDGTARLWRVADGTALRVIDGGGGIARFSADGRLLFTLQGGTIKLWRVSNGTLLQDYKGIGASAFAVAPNGQYFAYGRSDGVLVLARMPLVIVEINATATHSSLQWQGGNGLYQLQRSTDVTAAVWENVGTPSTNRQATVSITGPSQFFRVQSLPESTNASPAPVPVPVPARRGLPFRRL